MLKRAAFFFLFVFTAVLLAGEIFTRILIPLDP